MRQFLRAYKRGLQDYTVLNKRNLSPLPGSAALVDDTAGIIAKYIYPNESAEAARKKVQESAFYVDPTGRIDASELAEQIKWYFENGFITQSSYGPGLTDSCGPG